MERVWSTPMQSLASGYGLSDVGLAKVCRKHNVPRPPRGHWAKLAHCKPVERPGLPAAPKGVGEIVVLVGTPPEIAPSGSAGPRRTPSAGVSKPSSGDWNRHAAIASCAWPTTGTRPS